MAAGDADIRGFNALLLGDDVGVHRRLGATLGGALHASLHHDITSQRDATLNDSDKSFTVPANRIWNVHSVYVQYTSTATAGTRNLVVQLRDVSGNIYGEWRTSSTFSSSTTHNETWAVGHGAEDVSSLIAKLALFPSLVVLPAGFAVRVIDSNAVDTAADDMIVALLYDELTL